MSDAMIVGEILNLLTEHDTFAVAARVEASGGPIDAAKLYVELINELYWKQKNVTLAIEMGRLGAHFCLSRANDSSPEAADELRGIAKQMAFNMGSFAWPGWAEPGITISQADIAAGRDAAALNLRLAIELKRSPDRMANAHWLVGAYAIVDRRTDDAVKIFERAAGLSDEGGDQAAAAMNRAYAALARLAVEPVSSAREDEFNEALKAIEAVESEDSSFYIHQLKTARGVLAQI